MRVLALSGLLAAMLIQVGLLTLAADPAPVEKALLALAYAPAADLVDRHNLRVDITEILLTDVPTGLVGRATGEAQFSTVAVAADGDGATLRLEVTKIAQQMAGRSLNSPPPQPVLLTLDSQARLKQVPKQEGQAAGEILSQGGLPLQALAVLCGLPQLPEQPVAVGDTWQRTDSYELPGVGPAQLEITTRFYSLQDGVAALHSNLRARIPDFEADNPLLPGQKIRVRDMVVDIVGLTQEYDLERSVVRQADGTIKAQLEATAPDLTLPLKLVAPFTYHPVAP